MSEKPVKIGTVILSSPTRYIHVLREGIFALIFNWGMEMYYVDEVKGVRQTMKKKFTLPQESLKLFQVPLPFDNILNVFFEEEIKDSKSFALWVIEVECFEKEVKYSKPLRVYEIAGYQRDNTRVDNYSKSIFLLNIGNDILAIRKGYVIDTASVSIQAGSNYLRYISNNRLIHLTDIKVELYSFTVNENVHPPRIVVTSMDSIVIDSLRK